MLDYLGSEYGYTKEDMSKLTMREISELIDSMYYRKSGRDRVETELSKDQEEKISKLVPKNFKERKNVRSQD
jgi:uncharacterized protein with von Willebrand factor type A (vWA) domain